MPIKTYFISGFLGSGKTTLLNNLLGALSDKKVGIIMNEFGQVNIDIELIEYKEGMEISEINNGSIFCTCLSGSFVKRILELSKLHLDYLLVESSGMARPARIGTILDQVNEIESDAIDYQGMITVVDGSSYLNLVQSLNAVREQVAYSDLVIINKIDLIDDTVVSNVEKSILSLNPTVRIIKTSYSDVDNIIGKKYYQENYDNREPLLACNEDQGMYKTLLRFNDMINEEELANFVEKVSLQTYRIKGLVQLSDDKIIHVDCAGNETESKPLKGNNKSVEESQLVFIGNQKNIKNIVSDLWEKFFDIEYSID